MVSPATLNLIKQFEGCRLKAYTDQGGRVTIGYGSTGPDIQLGLIWSQQQADERLQEDAERMQSRVVTAVKVPINSNQLAALTSFAYNCGAHNLERSGLLKQLNRSNFAAAGDEFLKWNKVGLYTDPGLQNRRAAERKLFLTPIPPKIS